MKSPHLPCLAGGILLAAVYFVSPIPHTAALRNLLTLALFILLAVVWKRGAGGGAKISRGPEIVMLGALTLWMAVQTSLWAVDRAFSFGELVEEWGGALLVAWAGLMLARRLPGPVGCADRLPAWIALALFIHAGWTLAWQVMQWVQTGRYALGGTPYGSYAVLSTPINMAFALLAADLAVRWRGDGRLFPWSGRIAQALLLVTSAAVVAVKARNGVVTVCVMLVLLALLLAWRERTRRAILAVSAMLALMFGLIVANVLMDSRWSTFIESAPQALDTKSHKAWLDDQPQYYPLLSSGQQAEGSAYMRIAWAKVALEGIASRPLGFGYGLGGFGRYMEAEHGKKGFVSSHSGILDFTLANGLPGLALFLAFCALLFRRGWRAWAGGNPWGLALMLTLTNYFVRILLDGHFGSFRLKMVALLLGILYWLTIRPTHDERSQTLSAGRRPAAQ